MTDRFRLLYLKSTGLEKSGPDKFSSNPDFKRITNSQPPSAEYKEYKIPETLSSETILTQARTDLKHPDPEVRSLAIKYYLEKSYPSIPMSILQEILTDRDPKIRAQVLRFLIQFRSPILAPLLKKHLKDSDPKVRIEALRGMFQSPEKIEINLLLQFLSDESPWVRRKVATLLGWTHTEGVLPILMELSRDEDSMVRKAALFSLAVLYPDESEDRFIEAMTDSDLNLRHWTQMILEKMMSRPLKRNPAFLPSRR